MGLLSILNYNFGYKSNESPQMLKFGGDNEHFFSALKRRPVPPNLTPSLRPCMPALPCNNRILILTAHGYSRRSGVIFRSK